MPVGVLFDTTSTSVLNRCIVKENSAITQAKLISELDSDYKAFITTDNRYTSFSSSAYSFQTMQGNLKFTNDTLVTLQPEILNSFTNSELTIESTIFSSITSVESAIFMLQSQLVMDSVTVTNFTISGDSTDAFLETDLESKSTISNITFTNNFGGFVFLLESEMSLDEITIQNVTCENYVLNIDQGLFEFSNSVVKNVTSTKHDSTIYYIDKHSVHEHGGSQETVAKEIEQLNLVFEDINQTVIYLYGAKVHHSDNITFRNSLRAMKIVGEGSVDYENSLFENLGSATLSDGAAFSTDFAKVTLTNVTLRNNQAINGGAMKLGCVTDERCDFNFTDCVFVNNTASQSGGAIKFDVYPPITSNILYENNSAPYGPNVAGYAVRAILKDSPSSDIILNDIGSGVQMTQTFTLQLVDFENKVMTLDNSSRFSIKTSLPNQIIEGSNSKSANQGEATFTDLKLTSHPGDQSVEFKISTTAVDNELVLAQYGELLQKPLIVNFSDRQDVIDFLVFLFIILCNVNFILNWVYNMLCAYKNVHIFIDSMIVILGFLLCKKDYRQNLLNNGDPVTTKEKNLKTPKVLIKSGRKRPKNKNKSRTRRIRRHRRKKKEQIEVQQEVQELPEQAKLEDSKEESKDSKSKYLDETIKHEEHDVDIIMRRKSTNKEGDFIDILRVGEGMNNFKLPTVQSLGKRIIRKEEGQKKESQRYKEKDIATFSCETL